MPVYQVVHAGFPFTLLQRDRIARGITKVHHDQTNAPEPFVRIVFQPAPFGNIYTAGEIAPSIVVFGNTRAGRSEVVRQSLVRGIYDVIMKETTASPDEVVIGITELPSSWLIEAGLFMPAPTDAAESAWIAELQSKFPGKFDDWGGEGKHPVLEDSDDETRLAHLREATKRYLKVMRGQGHDINTLIGELTELNVHGKE